MKVISSIMRPQKFLSVYHSLWLIVSRREWVYLENGKDIESGIILRACNDDTVELQVNSDQTSVFMPMKDVGFDFSTQTGFKFSGINTEMKEHLIQEHLVQEQE